MSHKLSVVMITRDSEKYLPEVLDSCKFTDEIVVVDSGSKDKTIPIAKSFGAKVIQKEWMGFGRQKQFAVESAKNNWVFVLDSDEVITKELQQEIKSVLNSPKFDAYRVSRLNYFFGKPIKTMGLYPDKTIRLFDKKKAYFTKDEVHEKVVCSGKVGSLKHHFLHYAYETIDEFIEKQNRYSSLNKKNNFLKAIINPYWTFFRLYFLKLGFLEGKRGFIIAKLYSQYTFWKYIK